MRGEHPHLGAAHEMPGIITRPRHKRDLEDALQGVGEACRDQSKGGSASQQDRQAKARTSHDPAVPSRITAPAAGHYEPLRCEPAKELPAHSDTSPRLHEKAPSPQPSPRKRGEGEIRQLQSTRCRIRWARGTAENPRLAIAVKLP